MYCGKNILSVFSGVEDLPVKGIEMTVINAARCEWHDDKTG